MLMNLRKILLAEIPGGRRRMLEWIEADEETIPLKGAAYLKLLN
jgi:hypothetical protein